MNADKWAELIDLKYWLIEFYGLKGDVKIRNGEVVCVIRQGHKICCAKEVKDG